MKVTTQLILTLMVVLGLNAQAHGNTQQTSFEPSYKVESCDCLGFSGDIPTFLSDLQGATDIDIFGEGQSPKAAYESAQNMCVEKYRSFASANQFENQENITRTGCKMFKSTQDGDWEAI